MTDDKLYDSLSDNLSDNLSEGGKKNRIRAMQLVAVCRYREQKTIGQMQYRLIAPKTWALKKKKVSPQKEAQPQGRPSKAPQPLFPQQSPDARTLPRRRGRPPLPQRAQGG